MSKYFSLFLLFLFSFFICETEAVYIKRFTTTDNGGILFTGNTLGLSKVAGQNQPGSLDSAGAFITTDLTQKVGNYPAGTTLEWQKNASYAYLDLPSGSTVLYAELVWSGSYGFENQIIANEPDLPITLITPQEDAFSISSDPATRQTAITPGFKAAGNYCRSADVTEIVKNAGSGRYTVGGVPATVSAKDNSHNAAGWTLAVVYQNNQMLTHNMTLFVGCEQASYSLKQPACVEGFCTPPTGDLHAQIFVSAVEGDSRLQGDRLLFGKTSSLDMDKDALSGENNPRTNFFCSQMNTLYPFSRHTLETKLVAYSAPILDTRGSFGTSNTDPKTGKIHPGDRQGYDITSVDITGQVVHNQQKAYALGTTTADDYTINALAMQIQVGAPIITASKLVNSQLSIEALIGDVVAFDFAFENIGTADANNLVFKDLLEEGLSFVPGSFTWNGANCPDPDLGTGFSMGNLPIGESFRIGFRARIDHYPLNSSIFSNFGKVDYQFQTCIDETINVCVDTNPVTIILPSQHIPNLTPKQLVNSNVSIDSKVGDIVTFTVDVENQGNGEAHDSCLKDQIPCGLEVVPDSVMVDNIVVKDADFTTGIPLGNINSGGSSNILFQARITQLPEEGYQILNEAVTDYRYLQYSGTYQDLSANSNLVDINLFADDINPPPSSFRGSLKKCGFLNQSRYALATLWTIDEASQPIAFRIYKKGKLAKQVDASLAFVYNLCLKSKKEASEITLSAVYHGNVESAQIPLEVIYE